MNSPRLTHSHNIWCYTVVQRRHPMLYYTILYYTILYDITLYCTLLYCTVPYHTMPCHAMLCSAMLCSAILYCTVLYCTVLYYTIPRSNEGSAPRSCLRWHTQNVAREWIPLGMKMDGHDTAREWPRVSTSVVTFWVKGLFTWPFNMSTFSFI